MPGIALNELELLDIWSKTDATRHARVNFPIFNLTGARSSSVVYFEVDPGKHLGRHTDSAEEILVILEGEADGVVGDQTARLSAGSLVLIPAMVPHDVICAGDRTVKIVGFFSSSTVVSIFDDPLEPLGRRVVGTPLPEEDQVAAAAA